MFYCYRNLTYDVAVLSGLPVMSNVRVSLVNSSLSSLNSLNSGETSLSGSDLVRADSSSNGGNSAGTVTERALKERLVRAGGRLVDSGSLGALYSQNNALTVVVLDVNTTGVNES